MTDASVPETSGETPRLPVYLDGELLETLAQTLDPSGVPGTRKVKYAEAGRTLEGSGYALKASGRIGTRLLGGQAGGERTQKKDSETRDDQSEEQEFIVREATLLWQAHSILREEGHLRVIDAESIDSIKPGDWVEFRTRSSARSILSLSRLMTSVLRLQEKNSRDRLDRLREGEALLRGAKGGQGPKFGDTTSIEMRNAFLQDLVASLAMASDQESLQAVAAVEGFADELQNGVITDVRTEFIEPGLDNWSALLTVRTEAHERLATAALRDAEFGVFGKVTLARADGESVRLVRRTMFDWMETEDLESLSGDMETSMGADALAVRPPLIQVLPLALWV